MDTTARAAGPHASTAGTPAHQVYRILQLGFVAAPILAGLDKFTNLLVNWEQYLAPFIGDIIAPMSRYAISGSPSAHSRSAVSVRSSIGVEIDAYDRRARFDSTRHGPDPCVGTNGTGQMPAQNRAFTPTVTCRPITAPPKF